MDIYKSGDVDALEAALDSWLEPNKHHQTFGGTLLGFSLGGGRMGKGLPIREDFAKVLMAHGADINARPPRPSASPRVDYADQPLLSAMNMGETAAALRMFKYGASAWVYEDGKPTKISVLHAYLDGSSRPLDPNDDEALDQLMKEFAKRGVTLQTQSPDGDTPLEAAVRNRERYLVRRFRKYLPVPSLRMKPGSDETLMHVLVRDINEEASFGELVDWQVDLYRGMFEELLELGGDPTLPGDDGNSVIDLLKESDPAGLLPIFREQTEAE